MPELPEVDAIAGVARKYAKGGSIESVSVLRGNGKYFGAERGRATTMKFMPGLADVSDVHRVGKTVVFSLTSGAYIVTHNAMTGFFDWEHEPWTFDYVEGKRKATDSDVRVKLNFSDGRVLRFHDARLFGSMDIHAELPPAAPELMQTPNGMPGRPIMTLKQFAEGLRGATPVKVRLMDQTFIGGIGNIYAAEACHLARIHPATSCHLLRPEEVSVLHSSLRWVVDQSIPQVRYDWLNVYRRARCGTCAQAVARTKLGGRSTFYCPGCQPT